MTLVSFGSQPFRYGIILKDLHNEEEARKMMIKSLVLTPLLWSSWQELAKLCKNREMVSVESINNKKCSCRLWCSKQKIKREPNSFLSCTA